MADHMPTAVEPKQLNSKSDPRQGMKMVDTESKSKKENLPEAGKLYSLIKPSEFI